MNFGETIKEIRGLLNMNQQQFSAFVNEDQSYISMVETGSVKMSYKRFLVIAKKAGFSSTITLKNQDHELIINH